MMRFLPVFVILLLADPSARALDPEQKTAYSLRVVVRIAEHPHFTEHFRRELKRELLGSLQASLGSLATVELIDLALLPIDKWEPLWKQVEEKGLEWLGTFNEIGGGKTHFLRVGFSEGHYDLQARQHDGTTGFVTPIVRKVRTHDRAFVGRVAGLMVGQDFGLVTTLEPGPGPQFFMRIKGSDAGAIDRWAKKGEVFALIKIHQERRRIPGDKATGVKSKDITVMVGTRVEGVLLRALENPREGGINCELYNRYEDPLGARGALGYRCVKLGTTDAPIRLQIVDPNGTPQQMAALQVFARGDNYPEGAREGDQATGKDGIFMSKERFAHVAFLCVELGGSRLARMPVEILDDSLIVRSVRLEAGAEARDKLEADRRGLLNRIADNRLIQVRCFQDITAFEKDGKKDQALARGQAVLKSIDGVAAEMREDIDKLLTRNAKTVPDAANILADCNQQLVILRNKQDELRQHLAALTGAIAADNDPAILEKQKKITDAIRKAELLASQAEYDDALKAYEDAIALVADEPAAKTRIETVYQGLKKAWTIRDGDAAHAEARKYIWNVWAKLATLQDVRTQIPFARTHFEKCKSVGDRLAANKMLISGVEVANRFSDELKKLIDTATEDEDKKTLEVYQKVSEDLQKLLKDVQDFILAEKK